jgi:hypothetical protein
MSIRLSTLLAVVLGHRPVDYTSACSQRRSLQIAEGHLQKNSRPATVLMSQPDV